MSDVYDKYIDVPKPYKALDGSNYVTIKEAEAANNRYWNTFIEFIINPDNDILLTPAHLAQIKLNPSAASLVSVLHNIMQEQLNEKNEKSMHK